MKETPQITKQQAWLMATRPKTLPAALAPVVVGTSLAFRDGAFRPLPALAALLGALLLQIGVNLANDYFDYVKGVDQPDRKGPIRVTQAGLIAPEQVRNAMIITLILAALIGIYLIWVGGWPILAIGVASILAALAYSGGPFPLASHGMGDLFVFIFFGLCAVCGTYYVQALTLTPLVVLCAAPTGLLITAILVVNNLRDIDSDRRAGKRTLAVILGETGARIEYAVLSAIAYLIPLVLLLMGAFSLWVLLPLLTLPLGVYLVRKVYGPNQGSRMNKTLADTAQLALTFSLLFSIGVML
jgi:1,4-dihydroxy-2-naphthoate polyprenyltransferase